MCLGDNSIGENEKNIVYLGQIFQNLPYLIHLDLNLTNSRLGYHDNNLYFLKSSLNKLPYLRHLELYLS